MIEPIPNNADENDGLTATIFQKHAVPVAEDEMEKINLDAAASVRITAFKRKFLESQNTSLDTI